MASNSNALFQPRQSGALLVLFICFLLIAALAGAFTTALLYGLGTLRAFALIVAIVAGIPLVIAAAPEAVVNLGALPKLLRSWGTLWLLLYVSGLVFRIRDAGSAKANPLDIYTIVRLGPEIVILGTLLLCLGLRRVDWPKSLYRGLLGCLVLYALVSAVSSLWSVYPSWTLYKSLELLLDLAVTGAILASFRRTAQFRNLLNLTCALYGAAMLWAWAGVLVFRQLAWDPLGRLAGVVPIASPNWLGEAGSILVIIALARLLPVFAVAHDRAWYTAVLVFGALTLIAAKTRNDMAACLCGILLVLLFSGRVRHGIVLASAATIALAFTSAGRFVWSFLLRGQNQSELYSLTGRMEWWTYAWRQFQHHPWTGLGAYAGGRFAVLGSLGFGQTASLHNDYLEALIGTSFWGLLPLVASLLGTWYVLVRFMLREDLAGPDRQLILESLGVLGVITVHSFFNPELAWHPPLTFLAVLATAEFLRRRKQTLSVPLPLRSLHEFANLSLQPLRSK